MTARDPGRRLEAAAGPPRDAHSYCYCCPDSCSCCSALRGGSRSRAAAPRLRASWGGRYRSYPPPARPRCPAILLSLPQNAARVASSPQDVAQGRLLAGLVASASAAWYRSSRHDADIAAMMLNLSLLLLVLFCGRFAIVAKLRKYY